ncbi:MAG: HAD-IIA family hydrolase [Actinomycetes bacterium]
MTTPPPHPTTRTSSVSWWRGSSGPLFGDFDGLLLDLDGVVYRGTDAIPGAPEAIARVRQLGGRVGFVTNNASRTPETVAAHLSSIGVPATARDVVTSAQAAAHLLAAQVGVGARVLAVGGEGLRAALRERGLVPVESMAQEPAAVVQGFDGSVDWTGLAEVCYAVASGLPWVATNMDLTIPTARGLAPGNGSLVGVVAPTTTVQPTVAGKPALPLHREATARMGAHRPLVVGDRLDTDIQAANTAGAGSVVVMSGVTDLRALCGARVVERPWFVCEDVSGVLDRQPEIAHDAGDRWSCGGWSVTIRGGGLVLTGGGERSHAVRLVAAASWSVTDMTGRAPDVERVATQLYG